MSHTCGRASSEKTFCIFSKHPKTSDKACCSVSTLTAPSKYFNHCKHANEQLKVKRLKTRKERSQMRGDRNETSKTKSHHRHHCCCKSRREDVFLQNFCHNGVHRTSNTSATISSVVAAAQEPSIITESRLTGHHRLFGHEVKSIDIERLLSEQSKHEKKKQVTEENTSASHIPLQLSGNAVAAGEEAESDAKTHDDPQEREGRNPQQSDITPGQRPQQQSVSSGSCKCIRSSKLGSPSVETKTKKRKKCLSPPADGEHAKTSNSKGTGRVLSDLEEPRENKSYQSRADGLKSVPARSSSSPTAESVDAKHREPDPKYVDTLVTAVAARLCASLCLSSLKTRNLMPETRNELQKALRSRHGPWLQTNLLQLQQCDGCETSTSQVNVDPEMKEELLPAEKPDKTTGSGAFSWDSSPQLHLQQAAEESNPEDTSVRFLDEIFRPCSSHPFSVDFEPSGTAANDVFVSSPNLFQEDKTFWMSWEEFRPKEEESAPFESFSGSFMNQDVTDMSCRQKQRRRGNDQPFFLQDEHPEDLIQLPQEEDPFEIGHFSFPHPFSSQIQHHPQPFDQLSTHPTSYMTLYPPSHMLELSPAPPPSSLPSPEHWSFPPMRLY